MTEQPYSRAGCSVWPQMAAATCEGRVRAKPVAAEAPRALPQLGPLLNADAADDLQQSGPQARRPVDAGEDQVAFFTGFSDEPQQLPLDGRQYRPDTRRSLFMVLGLGRLVGEAPLPPNTRFC